MHDHLEEGHGRDSYILEMMGIASPWLRLVYLFLLVGIVGVEGISLGIDQLDVVVELCYR